MMLFPIGILIASAASASLLILPDANPTLFFYEKWLSSKSSSNNGYSHSHSHPHSHSYASTIFKNKKVWITGASSGIGEEMAKELYHHGAKVILSGRRMNELERVGHSCLSSSTSTETSTKTDTKTDTDSSVSTSTSTNSHIQLLPFDITNHNDISDIVKEAIGYYDGIDILILNAGVGQLSPAIEESYDTTRDLMEVNFHSPVRLAMEVMKQDQWGSYSNISTNSDTNSDTKKRKKRKMGQIVLTSSVASKLPLPLGTSYAASKHAAHGYFTSLRSECQPWLRVDLPCPGPINTNFQTKAMSKVSSNTNNHNEKSKDDNNDNNNNGDDESDDDNDSGAEVKMSAERCAKLIIASMAGPKLLMQETWISKQPTLLFMYLNQYIPTFSNWFLGIIGSLRLKAFKAGLPLYQVSSWIKAAKMEKEEESEL